MADYKVVTRVIAELVSGNLICSTFYGRDQFRSGTTWWEISYAPTTVERWFWCFTITLSDDEFVLTNTAVMSAERRKHTFNTLDEAIAAAVSMFVLEDREQGFTQIPF